MGQTQKQFAAPGAYGGSQQNMVTGVKPTQFAPRQSFLSQDTISNGQVPYTPPTQTYASNPFYGEGSASEADTAPFCPEIHTCLSDSLQAKDAKAGDLGDCYVDGKVVQLPLLHDPVFKDVPCVLLFSDNGCSKIVSETTPLTLQDGSSALAPEMEGKLWLTDSGRATDPAWAICHVLKVGTLTVAMLDFGGNVFAGGISPKLRGFTHNMQKAYTVGSRENFFQY